AHIATPLGETGISQFQNEQPLLAAITATAGSKEGLYMFPAMNPGESMDDYQKKLASNPSGMVLFHNPGASAMTPARLTGEFIVELLMVLMGTWLLARSAVKGFGGRVGFFCVVGVIACLWTNFSYWNWYSFPTDYT